MRSTDTSRIQAITTRSRVVSWSVLALGATVVFWLTRYNLQPHTAWSVDGESYRSWEEFLLVNITGLVLPPALLMLGVLRDRADRFGCRPASRDANRIAFGLYLVMLPVLFIASRQPAFQNYYPMQSMAAYSWRYFLYFELTYGLYMLCWEFFYRGFLTQGLARAFHAAIAIGLQAVAFGVMHISKPMPEVLGSFVAGVALGWLALRGRSFYPCFALHWAASVTFDVLIIHAKPGGFL
jgi:uncharacterized protein